ncbi:hypothetical protein BpHYR1_032579 [Brachionus plicatilis]|uniref:Uncharacterized protein n=1 Tax=Brachionus plicatilis TaxID=10195 RepID=A0A3M7R486_BRAPC|nr:hypothetical protein BpHYR1_032579 [Brachionus plicatilis]
MFGLTVIGILVPLKENDASLTKQCAAVIIRLRSIRVPPQVDETVFLFDLPMAKEGQLWGTASVPPTMRTLVC